MRCLLFFLSVFTLFAAGCGEYDEKTLIMVTEATFPPYEFRSGGDIVGIDPDIIRAASDKLGYDLVIMDMAFDSVIPAVQTGRADIAASGITVTEERKKQVLFSVPYVVSAQVVIVRKNSGIAAAGDLYQPGIAVGVQHGTTGDIFVTKNIGEPERFANGALAIAALRSGKLGIHNRCNNLLATILAWTKPLRKPIPAKASIWR